MTPIFKVLIVLLSLSLMKDNWQYSNWIDNLWAGFPILFLLFFEWRNHQAKWDAQKVEANFHRALLMIGVSSGLYLFGLAYSSRSWELIMLPIFSLVLWTIFAIKKRLHHPTPNH